MAKKKAKKKEGKGKAAGKKTGKSAGKAKAKKGGKAKSAAKSLAPRPVKTGKGASCQEVGVEFMKLFNAGDYRAIEDRLWSPKVVSVEGVGVGMAWHGRAAVRAKNEEWMSANRIHGARADGPFVGAGGFSVRFAMDVEEVSSGTRRSMEEVGVYTIERGKIVREEFMYKT